jgi:fatty-acid desaturase
MENKQNTGNIFHVGTQVPHNVNHAYKLDAKNGSTKWHDSMQEEINALLDYSTFEDKG